VFEGSDQRVFHQAKPVDSGVRPAEPGIRQQTFAKRFDILHTNYCIIDIKFSPFERGSRFPA
jgi:hypothetical protein